MQTYSYIENFLRVQLVVLVSAFVMVSTVLSFLFFCSSTLGAPVPNHL